MRPMAIRADARYRVVDEARIIDLLALGGWAHEIQHGEHALAEKAAASVLDRWVVGGLPFAHSGDGGRYFDPAEVINFMKCAALREGDTFWEQRYIATGRRMVRGFHALENGSSAPPPASALTGAHFAVTLSREFDLGAARAAARPLLRLPLPIEDEALRDLEIEAFAPPDVDVDFTIQPGRLDVRVAAAPRRAIAVGVHLSFTAYPALPASSPAPLGAAEGALYTRPSEGLIKVSPRVRALAAELAGTEREPWKVVRRFWSFMLDELTCGVLHYDQLDASRPTDWVLETGWFDCQLGSALLIALCRARGIPARLIGGYQLYPAAPSPHYWAEVWSNAHGWLPLDTICSDLSARGRDAAWRDCFFGCLDYRMKTQCLPRLFSQNPSMPLPPAWHMLARATGQGIEVGFFANDEGALVYRDRISVRREAHVRDPRR